MFRALYSFNSEDSGTLNCKDGDQFTVLDKTLSSDWWLAQNGLGQVGYVPRTYLVEENVRVYRVMYLFSVVYMFSFLPSS